MTGGRHEEPVMSESLTPEQERRLFRKVAIFLDLMLPHTSEYKIGDLARAQREKMDRIRDNFVIAGREAVRAAVAEESEAIAGLAEELGAYYETSEPNPAGPGLVCSNHPFAAAIRARSRS